MDDFEQLPELILLTTSDDEKTQKIPCDAPVPHSPAFEAQKLEVLSILEEAKKSTKKAEQSFRIVVRAFHDFTSTVNSPKTADCEPEETTDGVVIDIGRKAHKHTSRTVLSSALFVTSSSMSQSHIFSRHHQGII